MPSINDFTLKFGHNKDLRITEEAKVVEAFMHNDNERLTLIYKGLGSYTFKMNPSKPLVEPSDWLVMRNQTNRQFNLLM